MATETVEYRVERSPNPKFWEVYSYVNKDGHTYRNWVAMTSDYNAALKTAYELTFVHKSVAAAKEGAA